MFLMPAAVIGVLEMIIHIIYFIKMILTLKQSKTGNQAEKILFMAP